MRRKSTLLSVLFIACIFATIVIGSTYAYFIDDVQSTGNVIKAGNLQVSVKWTDDVNQPAETWNELRPDAQTPIFGNDRWEPNYTEVRYIRVTNEGELAFQYRLDIVPTLTAEKPGYQLGNVIEAYVQEVGSGYTAPTGYQDLANMTCSGTVASMITSDTGAYYGKLLAPKQSITLAVVLHMDHEAGNEYQGLSVGDGFQLVVHATQTPYERDAFSTGYDAGAQLPENPFKGGTASMPVSVANGVTTADVILDGGEVLAFIPAGTKVNPGTTSLTLNVTRLNKTASGITADEGETLLPVDVHVDGVAADNDTVIIVTLSEALIPGLNQGNTALYHVENGRTVAMTQQLTASALTAHNQYYYNPADGTLMLAMKSFSEVAVVADAESKWEGKFDYSWYTATPTETAKAYGADYVIANADQLAGFGAIVGGMNGQTQDSFTGKTVKLIANINLGDDEKNNNPNIIFYPIGYYNSTGSYEKTSGDPITSSVSSFEGIFDGQGHTISNFYQNTWEMFGDYNDGYSGTPNHYKDAMGLFGYVKGGTVKNLTVDNFKSDGEYTPTGVIAAYADGNSTFENIAITKCNPRVYNTGNGGIIGIAGDTSAADDDHITLKNITVDNSNTISALWGSWDVACGGLVGMYRGNVDGNGNATGDTISFTNCHVSAQIDVYNDVCANYQYYAYRYSGMIIGSVRHNTTNTEGKVIPNMTGISATGCTVNYGDWNDYYYCEFEKNTMASYSEDYQFSRVPHSELNFTDSNGNGAVDADERASVTGCKHTHTAEENHQAIYLPFHQLFTGYSWGVSSIGLEQCDGIKIVGVKVEEGNQQESEYKFNKLFTNENYLYRVGNQNAVPVNKLFAAKTDAKINTSGVIVSIETVAGNVVGTVDNDISDWTKRTIQFTGTGVVKVTIQDYNFCKPTVLYLEVVDAKNITKAEDATVNDVVLLNDTSASSLKIANGYAFYGNGFEVKFGGDGSYRSAAVSYGFVTVENGGILDNVQVKCNIFPESYMFASEMKAGSDGRYPYGYSAVVVSGNSTISNCYIYGARNNIQVGVGNVTIKNTVTECGSLSNIHINSNAGYTVTLDNVTTIQYQTTSDYDPSKKVLGFGILVGTNESESNPTIKLTGDLLQYNWVTDADKSVSNSYAKTAITEALKVEEYQHGINNTTTVNMGIVYLNEKDASIKDERNNKETIPYELNDITMLTYTGQVYSIQHGEVTAASRYNAQTDGVIPYKPNANDPVYPTAKLGGNNSAIKTALGYDEESKQWQGKVSVDLDNISGGSYDFKFSNLLVQKYGINLEYTIKDGNGNTVEKNSTITLNQLMTSNYTLVVTDNQIYNKKGEQTSPVIEREIPFVLSATKTSIDPPKFTNAGTATAIRLVSSKGGDWRPAYTALTGVTVTYWSASESKVKTVDLSTLYNSGTISSNVWTYTCNDYTLTITGGAVHSDGTTITPVVSNNTLYFASTNKAFGTGTTSRNIILTYVFTDKNASATWNRTETVQYSALSEYSYSSFKNGTLEAPSSGGTCLTPDTLITLADGSQKRVDSLTGEEMLLVWNLETGAYDAAPIVFVDSEEEAEYEVIHLYFSDGTDVKVIYEHGYFDVDLGKYVYLDNTAAQYVGHRFVKQGGIADNAWEVVTLTDVVLETEVTTAWSPVTFSHLCYYTNGMLSMPGGIEGLFNIFDVDVTTMAYDPAQKQADINAYGLFTYADFADLIPEEAFEAFNGAYLKVAMGKGMITWEDIAQLAERYVPLMR